MFTKTVNYTDFNGNAQSETLRFNYTKLEIIAMDARYEGGLNSLMTRFSSENPDPNGIVDFVRSFILGAYGTVSSDGKRFVKTAYATEEFSQSAAFDELFEECVSNPEVLSAFVTGCIPANLKAEAAKAPIQSA